MGCLNVTVTDLGHHLNGLTIIDICKHLKIDATFVCTVSDTDYEIFVVSEGVLATADEGNYVPLKNDKIV